MTRPRAWGLLLLLIGAGLRADAPLSFQYQGRLADLDGNPRSGSFDMIFELYGQDAGGAALFADARTGAARVAVVNGVFSVRVGEGSLSGQPLAQALAGGADRWLQVTVEGVPLLPRRKLASASYALSVRADGVAAAELAPLAAGPLDLAPGAVTGGRLADGAVGDAHVVGVDWSKITGLPPNLGSPAAALDGTVVEPVASTFAFSGAAFAVSAGTPERADASLAASSVTLRGNSFNAPGRLLLLDGAGRVPVPQAAGAYPDVTGVGTVAMGAWNATPVGLAYGGTGASWPGGALASLGAAASSSTFAAGAGLIGGGSFAGDRTVGLDPAAIAGGCDAPSQKLVWSSATLRLECGMDRDSDDAGLGGDAVGLQTNALVTRLRGRNISASAPAAGRALKWNQTLARWEPAADDAGPFSGSGSAGYFARWTGPNSLGAALSLSTTAAGVAVNGNLSASGPIVGFGVTSGSDPGHTHTAYAAWGHTHASTDIVSGVLPGSRGGTGMSSFTAGSYVRAASTSAWELRTPSQMRGDISAAPASHSHAPGSLPPGFDNHIARFNGDAGYDRAGVYQTDTGRLGIGTLSPSAPLHVVTTDFGGFGAATFDHLVDAMRITGGQTGLEVLCQYPSCRNYEAFHSEDSGASTTSLVRRGLYATVSGGGTLYGIQLRVHGDGDDELGYGLAGDVPSSASSTESRGVYGRAYGGVGTKYGLYGEATGPGDENHGVWAGVPAGPSNWAGFFQGNVHVNGALSKLSGTFDIPHPDPAREAGGWRLRHSFVESPTRGDNLYHWTVRVESGKGKVDLPGYFRHLNEDVQVWVAPKGHFGRGSGDVSEDGARVEIIADRDGEYNVLVMGTRKDEEAKKIFDEKGVEYRP